MMKYFAALVVILTLLIGCGASKIEKEKKQASSLVKNIFHDPVRRDIYDLQNQRDTAGLIPYLSRNEPKYRRAAAIALASVQAPDSVNPLANALTDSDQSVREAAAYALGQTRSRLAAPLLVEAFKKESSPPVKTAILEALGKCGSEQELTFVIALEPGQDNTTQAVNTGRAWALYRFGLQSPRPVVSTQGTALAVDLLAAEYGQETNFIAAHYLARTRDIDLKPFQDKLLDALTRIRHLNTRMALAAALGKADTPTVLERLKMLFSGQNEDYRVKVNALRSMSRFQYDDVKDIFFNALDSDSNQVAVQASEFFVGYGKEAGANRYFEVAKQLTPWRVRSNMLEAALKSLPAGDSKNRRQVSDFASAALLKTANPYEKAWLFNVLAWDMQNYMFIRNQIFDNPGKEVVTGSYGIAALSTMYGKAVKAGTADEKLADEFSGIFKRAIASGDPSMISVAAAAFRNPDMKFKPVVKDTGFLTQALEKCQLPQDIEPWLELKKTIAYFNAGPAQPQDAVADPPMKNRAVDWQLVQSIAPDHKVRIKTSRGDIVVQLNVDESPGSVCNFIRLIREGYYQKSVFHRVVPNFVIQDGCPRGDGWGGPAYTIGSEFGPLYYQEGSVGMASAGKDTEGSQWFITHSPTPHLDGRYTIFARVIEGMDTVHHIQVGDRVLGFEELN